VVVAVLVFHNQVMAAEVLVDIELDQDYQ